MSAVDEYVSKEDLARLRARDGKRASRRSALRDVMRASSSEIDRAAVAFAEAGFGVDAITAWTQLDRKVISVLVLGA